MPYAVSDKTEHYFKKSQFRVLHAAERILIVAVKTPILHETIHVWHTPHHEKGSKKKERSKWWKE
eukprot:2460302-Pyramimonas_sp.AAC.1